MPEQTAAPKTTAVPVANAPATNAPTPSAADALALDERFAMLAAQFTGQVNAQIEMLRQEFLAKFSQDVDPLHSDLHDLLDLQTQAGARIEKLEAANFVTPDGLQKQIESLANLVTQKVALKIQPAVQPVVTVTDQSIEDRVKRLESRLRFF